VVDLRWSDGERRKENHDVAEGAQYYAVPAYDAANTRADYFLWGIGLCGGSPQFDSDHKTLLANLVDVGEGSDFLRQPGSQEVNFAG